MKPITPEFISSLTSIVIATIGGIIGVAVLFLPSVTEAKWATGMGLAGTTIAEGSLILPNFSSDRSPTLVML